LQCLAYHVLYLDRHDPRSSIQVWVPPARVECKDDRNVGTWLNYSRSEMIRDATQKALSSPFLAPFIARPDVRYLCIGKHLLISLSPGGGGDDVPRELEWGGLDVNLTFRPSARMLSRPDHFQSRPLLIVRRSTLFTGALQMDLMALSQHEYYFNPCFRRQLRFWRDLDRAGQSTRASSEHAVWRAPFR